MEIEYIRPADIEKKSFSIIGEELTKRHIFLPEDQAPVTKRVIHTTADFDYADTLVYSDHAVEKAVGLLNERADIVTDTNMARAGINKNALAKLGGEVHCWMADPEVAAEAKERGITRAAVSMERASALEGPVIYAIGNAPTALISLYELMRSASSLPDDHGETGETADRMSDTRGVKHIPDFVIGVPVGFVNVEAAKELFLKSDVPHIINRGRKGGSNVAAAICNALIYLAGGRS